MALYCEALKHQKYFNPNDLAGRAPIYNNIGLVYEE